MGYVYNGDIVLKTPLTVESDRPLDNRTVVKTEGDLLTINPTYAYNGMLVSVLETGNSYMLLDKSKINLRVGWKASYEAILIVPCTLKDYKKWKENTYFNDPDHSDWTPIDPSESWLLAEAYYYIYEDSIDYSSDDQRYISVSEFKAYEETVNSKASNSDLTLLIKTVNANKEILLNNYYDKSNVDSNFINKEWLGNKKGGLPAILDDYVTKEYLTGSDTGEGNFIFVTQTLYSLDQNTLNSTLSSKADKIDLDAKVNSSDLQNLVATLKIVLNKVGITLDSETLKVGDNLLATQKSVPKMECLTISEYQTKLEADTLLKDIYYLTYEETEDSKDFYITNSFLTKNYENNTQIADRYYSKTLVDEMLVTLKQEILNQLNSL